MIPLIQPGSGKVLRVPDEAVEFWRSLGYRDPAPASAPRKEAPRKRAAKKSAADSSDDE